MFRLEDLTLFVRAAALGSFSDAAREAGQQPAPDAGGGDLAALRHPDARYPRGRSAEDPDPGR